MDRFILAGEIIQIKKPIYQLTSSQSRTPARYFRGNMIIPDETESPISTSRVQFQYSIAYAFQSGEMLGEHLCAAAWSCVSGARGFNENSRCIPSLSASHSTEQLILSANRRLLRQCSQLFTRECSQWMPGAQAALLIPSTSSKSIAATASTHSRGTAGIAKKATRLTAA
jgi:hypothetical protein